MLYTDSDCCSSDILAQIDPEVLSVIASASKPGQPALQIDGPLGVCRQAWAECRAKLESSLASFSTFVGTAGMQAHLAAVYNTGGWWGGNGTRPRLRLNQIVVGDTFYSNSLSPLQRWVTYSALMLLFQTMANRLDSKDKSGDRYEKKRAFYEKERARWWSMIVSQGLPYVFSFLDRPGSTHGYNAGIWDNTALTLTSGETVWTEPVPAKIAITYVDQRKYVSPSYRQNAESEPSEILTVNVPPNEPLTVSIASLNPPNTYNPPDLGVSQPVAPMLNASGWHIYAGTGNGPMYLQTTTGPIPITQPSATILEFRFSGVTMQPGQAPEGSGNALFGNVVQRG